MPQFTIYRNPNPRTRRSIPFLLDVQSALLESLATRVVVPLVRGEALSRPAERLHPTFTVDGREVVMSTAELAGVPVSALGKRVGTLAEHRTEIVAALDFLFTGV